MRRYFFEKSPEIFHFLTSRREIPDKTKLVTLEVPQNYVTSPGYSTTKKKDPESSHDFKPLDFLHVISLITLDIVRSIVS